MHRLPEFWVRLGLVLCSIFLTLALLEVALRAAGNSIDAAHRARQRESAGLAAHFKVLCVGESTTFGIGTNDPDREGYPHQLELLLNDRFMPIRSRCFFNQGIGLNTSEILHHLPETLDRFKPDVVILMLGLNNWWNLNNSNVLLFNNNRFLSQAVFKAAIFLDGFRVYKLVKWACYSSGLCRFSSDIVFPNEDGVDDRRIQKRQEMASQFMAEVERRSPLSVFFQVAEYDIRQMIRLCRSRGAKVVVATYPGATFEQLTQLHRQLAREEGVVLVDNQEYFGVLEDRERYFTTDEVHPNAAGYRLLAENIFNGMLENAIVPGGAVNGERL
jgi:lysophospholipase L1-like esterase